MNQVHTGDLTELRSFKAPPEKIKTVVSLVMQLLNKKDDWKTF